MKKIVILEAVALILLAAVAGFFFYQISTIQPQMAADATQPAAQLRPVAAQTGQIKQIIPEPEAPEPVWTAENVYVGEHWGELLSGRKISAMEYFVYDLDAERFLIRTMEPEDILYPASITKLFTTYVALQYVDPAEQITVGPEIELIDPDSSVADLKIGDVLTVEQLVAAMLLPSGNDASYVLTTAVGRLLAEDPELNPWAAMDRFVEQMNLDAAALGMTGSHFVTPDGIHSAEHYISLQDMVTIGRLALEHETISGQVAQLVKSVQLTEERSLTWLNTNLLLDGQTSYYCPYTIGLKTGFTTPAGYCVLSAVKVEGRSLMIGVFGCPEVELRFTDTLQLFVRALDLALPAPVLSEAEPEVQTEAQPKAAEEAEVTAAAEPAEPAIKEQNLPETKAWHEAA